MRLYPLEFVVEGSGEFPIDMLSREQAYPATSVDSFNLRRDGERRVKLLSLNNTTPHVKAWESMTKWKVVSIAQERLTGDPKNPNTKARTVMVLSPSELKIFMAGVHRELRKVTRRLSGKEQYEPPHPNMRNMDEERLKHLGMIESRIQYHLDLIQPREEKRDDVQER